MKNATTPTDEAFTLLLLETCYDRCMASAVVAKYTTRGKATGGSRKYEGWTEVLGRKIFNEPLVKFVKSWQREVGQPVLDQQESKKTSKKSARITPAKLTECVDDLFDNDEHGGDER